MPVLWWVLPLLIGVWALGLWLHASRERGVRLRGLPIWTGDLQPLRGLDDVPHGASLPTSSLKLEGVLVVKHDERTWWTRYRVRDTWILGRHVRLADGRITSEYFALRRYLPWGAFVTAAASLGITIMLFRAGASSAWAAGFMLAAGHGLIFVAMRALRGRIPTAAEARVRVLDAHDRLTRLMPRDAAALPHA